MTFSPQPSHTERLAGVAQHIMAGQGVSVETLRLVDYQVAPGIKPDMTQEGVERDDWPVLFEKVRAADILVVASPVWLGERSSVCARLYL